MNALELKNLTKTYPGHPGFQLTEVNLTLPGGCIMGLIGENGAGKSTVFKLILGIIEANYGSVTILGRGQKELPLIKEDIGVVLDEVGLPQCLTAMQMDAVFGLMYSHWDRPLFRSLLKKMAVPEEKSFDALSRGMKMKLGLAIALSHHPKLLLLDEATSGIDPVARDEIIDMLMDFTRDESHSILISSHIVSDLEKLCDYIAFLHKGKLLLLEEKDRLLEQYAIVRCSHKDFAVLPPAAIRGKKETAYGITAIAERAAIPAGWSVSPVSIEELFIFMVKEAR